MLRLVYDSLTGNVRHFAETLAAELHVSPMRVQDPAPTDAYLLLTYTFGSGEVPASTRRLLTTHGHLLRGVVASGSYHWGHNFARAADVIAAEYRVPVVAKLNKGGTAADRAAVRRWLLHYAESAPPFPTSCTGEPTPWNAG
ncbi:class Ib ribonucleoside-diphosphate reductase assembly flavoprotein NrdI [Deinococcus radiodurans]|uniref:Protein NrdI n=1 Tax=Deinococcus radiodurans (strain ATCC 13939 / DSM 20539 / JCM 16871 / CCUG 27074 / LMG 4051 / NBRC 15346 / NCIMB 9279 / VKM B-1422 / R1) TaxID=243230 RepID=NRDI_DEIRA|nr:class Ib ribonucleoside-diphosphate reductase assembly flavoprotein NrdI [Deinococcus radiodurans]Q9RZL8.1 RecName: Full=Protein NrdI [Deinococcus radiodurans R1 = ATCC 13939 = DSM 20539]AAF12546.1 ribonucleotide reductase, NrdI family [Deinococcus radiodurans R1 = ATCC 13939 = DSM 20539]ANC73255.1 ribonucleoside-diphosphate reductase [Deinococcus radiodurans R1 = ATCC 13939 = DSM 20539]QEM73244.1 class Ib ribonucleoside-diphosphate reductase assembly flavoprotein NrdI [Deinococcus radiodura